MYVLYVLQSEDHSQRFSIINHINEALSIFVGVIFKTNDFVLEKKTFK